MRQLALVGGLVGEQHESCQEHNRRALGGIALGGHRREAKRQQHTRETLGGLAPGLLGGHRKNKTEIGGR